MQVQVKTASKNYKVCFSKNPLKRFIGKENVVVITDENIFKYYSEELKHLNGLVIPAGEASKSLGQLEVLANRMVEMNCSRETVLVALGGGVVGDLTGFLAATYMRGLPFYQVPTSLMAMVDASIGGKTGVNLSSGKNLVGSFWQPEEVLINPLFLKTLLQKEFLNGMAEVIKHAILNKELFEWLEANLEKMMDLEEKTLKEMLIKNLQIKADIVNQDERESNQRKLLNLGHSLAHALEKLSGYTLPHGFAVAQGLVFVAEFCEMKDVGRLIKLLKKIGLPHKIKLEGSPSEIVEVMMSDKKRTGDNLTLILPKAIGEVEIVKGIKKGKVKKHFEKIYNSK